MGERGGRRTGTRRQERETRGTRGSAPSKARLGMDKETLAHAKEVARARRKKIAEISRRIVFPSSM